jgi:hypothetical protein
MGFFTGRTGSLVYLGKPVAKVARWELSVDQEALRTTKISDFVETYTPGKRTATGTAQLYYYRLSSRQQTPYTEFSKLIQKLVRSGIPSPSDRVELTLSMGPTFLDQLVLKAWLTTVSLGSATNEVGSVEISFTMDGDFVQGLGA